MAYLLRYCLRAIRKAYHVYYGQGVTKVALPVCFLTPS